MFRPTFIDFHLVLAILDVEMAVSRLQVWALSGSTASFCLEFPTRGPENLNLDILVRPPMLVGLLKSWCYRHEPGETPSRRYRPLRELGAFLVASAQARSSRWKTKT